jgi:hypothetical protein
METNKEIKLTGNEALKMLREINVILISLHDMGTYYMDKETREYEKETTRFVDEWRVTSRLAQVRGILSSKFDNTLGADDMDDIERAMEGLKYWEKPGDIPNDILE